MIGYLRGALFEKGSDAVLIDVHGVGYRVTVSQTTLAALPQQGQPCELRIHTHVREDALALFGFATTDEEELFHLLTSVSGVGPKLGMNILSGLPPTELAIAIADSDLARLSKIHGVGKKTAERLCVELADKLKTSTLLQRRVPASKAARPAAKPGDELLSALQNLGYRPADAQKAADAARDQHPGADLGELVRVALQLLMSKAV